MNKLLKKTRINFKKFRLKPAKPADLKAVLKLFWRIDKSINEAEVKELIADKRVYVLKDRKRKVKAAFAHTIYTLAGLTTIVYISKLSVHPSLEGQGIGSFLLGQIKSKSIKIGATAFFLYSVERAREFYKKNQLQGFWRFFWWKNKSV